MESSLKLITSNIRFANSGDGIHDWQIRRGLLQEIYHSFEPDILGTQEGRREQLYELQNGLRNLNLSDSHRQWIPERMYPCLFFNPDTITVEKSGDLWLSSTPDVPASLSFGSTFPRLCTWAFITMKKDQTKLMVINTHLDHVLQSTRIEQINVLITEMKKIIDRPVILMGDFNESPKTQLQEIALNALNLKDPWTELKIPEEASHHGFKGNESKGERIDWILIPKTFESKTINLLKNSSEAGVFPSDHYPLLATVIPK